jgi:ligand-binding sensor domain-containing protein/signal transduction histidine kinase
LNKPSPKQKRSLLSGALRYCIQLLFFVILNACHHPSPIESENIPSKKAQSASTTRNDSFAPPKAVPITAANLPKSVRIGKPTIRIDSSNGGVPFLTNYGTEEGLPLSEVSCSFADRAGNLWVGTVGGGISRFDGRSFTNYTTNQGLASNSERCIMQDRSGNIWIGTNGNGASRYDGKTFTNYTKDQGIAGNNVRSVTEDKNGNIWFGTDAGLSRYDGSKFTNYSSLQGLADNSLNSIMQDRDGNIWSGTESGASRFDGKTFTNFTTAQGLGANEVTFIMQDRSGYIWFGSFGKGVSRFDGKTFTKYGPAQGLAGTYVRNIMQARDGDIWFATEGGRASRYDGKTFVNYNLGNGLAANNVYTIAQDKGGDIWLGTFGAGLVRYEGKSFSSYPAAEEMTGNIVYSILQDRAGGIWLGTDQGGVSRYDGKTFTRYTVSQGLVSNSVWSMMQDKSGDIWFGTNGVGVSRYDGRNFTTYTLDQGLPDFDVQRIIQDRKGGIWFGTEGGGATRYDGKIFTTYTTAQGLAGNGIITMFEDRVGDIWFGTNGAGVSRYDGERFTNYTLGQGLASNSVNCILQDETGNIWFGTAGDGVYRYDGKVFSNYTTGQGLADNVVYAMAEDTTRHILWIGTNLGLTGLRQIPSGNGDSSNYSFEIFNKNTGYPIKDLNTNALLLDNKGILWAGCGDNKLISFNYDAVDKNSSPLVLQIQNLKVNNENVFWNNLVLKGKTGSRADSMALINEMVITLGKSLPDAVLDSIRKKYIDIQFDSIARFYPVPVNLVLPYKDNNLSIDFVAIETAKPNQVKYQYKLEGYNKDWSPPGNGTTAVFGNIPEGSYTFKLKALSPYGIWSGIEYTFKVLPPWYRAWWAYLLFGVLFIAVVWVFIYYRSKQLRRKNRLLEEKVNRRTHQLKEEKEKVESTLAELKSTQAQLIQSEKMASLGELTAGIAHEIQNPLNFVNNFSEVNTELIEELKNEALDGKIENVISLVLDIRTNEEKINHHGKRADAIVKGMLQHSRANTGLKEPTDINALADEYFRLAYHGFKARDNSFNTIQNADFDITIGKIDIIPQDIGRVLLNLYNNAFYALTEKKKQHIKGYEPMISVSTKKMDHTVEIRVKDNGNGIPQKVVDKIFQPFFTTKPAGQGIGLGLSLSYDIVKAHHGEIKVETREGEFTEFVMLLPVSG